jgi:hypothetical protein
MEEGGSSRDVSLWLVTLEFEAPILRTDSSVSDILLLLLLLRLSVFKLRRALILQLGKIMKKREEWFLKWLLE